jgi:putative ABC transport system permease protein
VSFFAVVVRNLVRQRVRTALTIVGISIGITTIIALGALTGGMRSTLEQFLELGGADFIVAQKGASDLSFSMVPADDAARLNQREDIAWADGVAMHVARVGTNPYFLLLGVDMPTAHIVPALTAGRLPDPANADEIVLGEQAATSLGYAIGDTLVIDRQPLTVTGIYRSGATMLNGGGITHLATVQQLGSKPGLVTVIFVKARDAAVTDEVAAAVRADYPQVSTIETIDEYGQVDQGMRILDALNLAISILAVGIGAIGVMNTMVMSVFERTREIGVLRAVGWSSGRIIRMVRTESLILCVFAAFVGIVLGVAATRIVMVVDVVRSFLEPRYDATIFARALLVAVVVALVGAVYPALRAVRLTPMEALRHE